MTDLLYWVSENVSDVQGAIALLLLCGLMGGLIFYIRGRRDRDDLPEYTPADAPIEVRREPLIIEPLGGASAADELLARMGTMVPATETPPFDPLQETEPSLAAPDETPPRYRLVSRDIRNAFHGDVPPVRTSLLYNFWMLIVAATVVLLPLLYLALVGVAGYGVYYYAFPFREVIFSAGVNRVTLAAYIIPLLVGAGVLLFMVSPLFVLFAGGRRRQPVELDPTRESLVFCLVEEICKAVGAPMPKKIYVDTEVNASAGLRRGIWSALSGGDLVLTIGLPLVASMNINQLAGVLAHEFGHFKQGTGTALSYVIRQMNFLLALMVYRPKTWDDEYDPDAGFSIIAFITNCLINITRGILWVLLTAARMVSSSLMRQQEYDADRYEALLAGTRTFSSTTFLFPQLQEASRLAYRDLRRAMQRCKGRPALAASFPALIVTKLDELPDGLREQIIMASLSEKTGFFDTHPSPQARVDAVNQLGAPGFFHLDRPATDLFPSFDELCTEVTFDHYREALGPLVQPDILIPNDEFLARYSERVGPVF